MKLINCNHIKKGAPPLPGCCCCRLKPEKRHTCTCKHAAALRHNSGAPAAVAPLAAPEPIKAATATCRATRAEAWHWQRRRRTKLTTTLFTISIGKQKCRQKLPSFSQSLLLSLMCLIVVSDFQQQIANQCAQPLKIDFNGEDDGLANEAQKTVANNSRNSISGNQSDRPTAATAALLYISKAAASACRCASSSLIIQAEAIPDANRLYEDLMMTYNRIVRPVQNNSDRVVVKLSLKLSQLIDVNLKNQMMTTNVWLNQEWSDYKLKWDPSEYGGIKDINVPAEQIWLPDIVLYNSAEGYFAVSIMTKAKVRYDGHVTWNPPAIFRSSCQIDITYFPFDSQNCHLKFGSWTFGTKIDLRHINDTEQAIERGTDLSEYYQNVEWDIMQASARRNVITYICCPNDFYPDVTFNFTLRRKPLFYTVNLILPCIGITILSFLVFYLPSDSGEKVTLTISILVSLIFFLSVLIETIPSTSLAMPLLGKYLVFTMILITVSVCATVCVLNIHFRTPSTHSMSPWVKRWCIDILPKYLFMNVPQYQSQQAQILPEQLIYLHNQAYQVAGWPLNTTLPQVGTAATHEQAQAQTQPNHIGELKAAKKADSDQGAKVNQIQMQYQQEQQSSIGGGVCSRQQSLRQLDPSKLLDTDNNNSSNNNNNNNNKLSISPSSLFLPYLQSEAARRLQMQRSRSSDRDNRSTSENQAQNTANTTTSTSISTNAMPNNINNNNNCDRSQRGEASLTINTNTNAITTNNNNKRRQVALDGSFSIEIQQQKPATTTTGGKRKEGNSNQQQKVRGKRNASGGKQRGRKQGGGFWGLFGSSSAAPAKLQKQTEQSDGGKQGEENADSEENHERRPVARPTNSQHQQLQHDTSSSFENNYQHHSHFQARASVCGTNLWRIGPTRRCSMTVPNNYPTYYRPLAQLTHLPRAHAHQHGGSGCNANQLSTVSGCLQSHHYHTHLASLSSSDEGSSPASSVGRKQSAIGALITAAATNLAVRPKKQKQQQQTVGYLQPSGSQEMRQLNLPSLSSAGLVGGGKEAQTMMSAGQHLACATLGRPIGHLQSTIWSSGDNQRSASGQAINSPLTLASLPTPPPPLPPEQPLQGQQQQRQYQMMSPAVQTVAMQRQRSQLDMRQPSFIGNHNQQQFAQSSGGFGSGHYPANKPAASLMVQSNLLPAGPSNSLIQHHSLQSNHLLQGSLRFAQQMQHVQYQAPTTIGGSFVGDQQQHSMPRSRSTDHRLHSCASDFPSVSGLYQQQLPMRSPATSAAFPPQLTHSSAIYRQQDILAYGQSPVDGAVRLLKSSQAQHQQQQQPSAGLAGPTGYHQQLMQAPQSVGRALGQAYMQRLQRQPTIYSLHSGSIQRPSRSSQRATAYLVPLDGQQQRQQQHLGNSLATASFSADQMRRSKSQTSLDRRAQLFGSRSGDNCGQCAQGSYLLQADSGNRMARSGHSSESAHNNFNNQTILSSVSGSDNNNNCNCDSQRRRLNSASTIIGAASGGLLSRFQLRQSQLQPQHAKELCYACCNGEGQEDADELMVANSPTETHHNQQEAGGSGCSGCRALVGASNADQFQAPPLTSLGLMRLISDVDKAIQNAMFIAQHIDNLDEFESVKENWKYIAMVIDRIFLIVFLFACIVGTVTIFAMVPWSYYTTEKPIDLQLTRLLALNLTQGEPYQRSCQEF